MREHRTKLVIAGLLIVAGVWMEIAGLFNPGQWLEFARGYTQHWWLIVVLILAQALLFTFALAGSLFLWIAAPLYPPPVAVFILASGGTLGGLGAYYFSRYLTSDWKRRIENSRAYRVLHRSENFFTLFSMRVFPGFPHSVVNYSAGILGARLDHFVLAAILGISIKSFIYARVIFEAGSTLSFEAMLDISIIGPLLLLSAAGLVAMYLQSR